MAIFNMSKTLLKSLFRGPYTTLYPLEQKEKFERTRGKIDIDMPQCIYCGMCQRRCPTGAIKVEKASLSWDIDRLKCIQCGYCSEVCPKKCLAMDNQYTAPSYGESKDHYSNA